MRHREDTTAPSPPGGIRAGWAAAPRCMVAVLLLFAISAAAMGCSDRTGPGAATSLAGPPPETTSPGDTTPRPPTTTGTAPDTNTTDGAASGGTSTTADEGAVSGDLETLRRLAISQYQEQDLEAATRTYEAMLALEDTDPLTHNNYANVLRDLGRAADAEKEYERALALDATLVTTYLNLAALHLREQNQAKALSVLDRGIAATAGADRLRLQDMKNQIAG